MVCRIDEEETCAAADESPAVMTSSPLEGTFASGWRGNYTVVDLGRTSFPGIGQVSVSTSTTEVTGITEKNHDRLPRAPSVCSVVNVGLIHDEPSRLDRNAREAATA